VQASIQLEASPMLYERRVNMARHLQVRRIPWMGGYRHAILVVSAGRLRLSGYRFLY
jgi:hypothetical protein